MMLSQLPLTSHAQIAFLSQGELLKRQNKNTESGQKHLHPALVKQNGGIIYFI